MHLKRSIHFLKFLNYILLKTMPMNMRILPQILHKLENSENKITLIHSNASLHCFFFFLISGKGVMNLSILDSIL
jgi:hypothetical protein